MVIGIFQAGDANSALKYVVRTVREKLNIGDKKQTDKVVLHVRTLEDQWKAELLKDIFETCTLEEIEKMGRNNAIYKKK